MTDAATRKNRIEVLNKINSLANKCNCKGGSKDTKCANCKELQRLGKELGKEVQPIQKHHLARNEHEKERNRFEWSEERVAFLREKRQTYSDGDIAKMLDVTANSVSGAAYRFKIDKPKIRS